MAAYAALLTLSQTTDISRYQGQYHFPINAKKTIRSIHEYVIFLLSFDDFPDKVNRWEAKIRDVSYRIEDIIEYFMWQQIQSSFREMSLSSVELKKQLVNVTEEIGLIAGEMMDERPAHSPVAVPSSSSAAAAARLVPTGKDAVIGLDDDQMAIKDRLCGLSHKLQVIPIVGMGGIGKTTLARTVYNDPLIIGRFQIRAWFTVSHDYGPHMFRRILLGLLESMKLLGEHMSRDEMDESEMALRVFQNLKGRRYLIVMDDVWGTNVLDNVRNIFPDDNNGSRIMLTTRLSDVAAYPDARSPLHEIQFLNDHQSWDLLKGKVFANGCCPPNLVRVGKAIARSCAGLPLAVVLLAGLLSAVNETRFSWEEIAGNENLLVGQGLEEVLSLSYTHLPHHLRPCFLFMGGFPEDSIIRASKLIRLWVAEGFLRHRDGCSKSLEEKAEEYLEDLVKRNLVVATSRQSDGRIKSCTLHDLVRDLCIRKGHEEKFMRVVDGCALSQGTVDDRHISFNRCNIKNIWGPTIRTILCFKQQEYHSWLAFIGQFRLLRVLDGASRYSLELPSQILELFHLRYLLPSQILELFHLRYLSLIVSSKTPSAISNLINLQTLIIVTKWGTGASVTLPLEIWRMLQLRHLLSADCSYELPDPPCGSNLPLENLLTLSSILDLVWKGNIVQMIPNVKKMVLVYSTNQDYHLHHVKDLLHLENLKLRGSGVLLWPLRNYAFPSSLKKLTLVGGELPWKDMSVMGSLPNLQVLKLLNRCGDGGIWKTEDGEFPQLKVLLIEKSSIWEWRAESNPLPRLERLVLRVCSLLEKIPEGIGEIPTLELIEVDNGNESLVESARRIKEDQQSYGNYALQVLVVDKYMNKTSI